MNLDLEFRYTHTSVSPYSRGRGMGITSRNFSGESDGLDYLVIVGSNRTLQSRIGVIPSSPNAGE